MKQDIHFSVLNFGIRFKKYLERGKWKDVALKENLKNISENGIQVKTSFFFAVFWNITPLVKLPVIHGSFFFPCLNYTWTFYSL